MGRSLSESLEERRADLEYLRVLQLAARTMQYEVEEALERLLVEGKLPEYESVRSQIPIREPEIPAMEPLVVDLQGYDSLLPVEAGP